MAKRCNTPGTLNVCQLSEPLTTKTPSINNLADLIKILRVISIRLAPRRSIERSENVKLTPIMNMNQGLLRIDFFASEWTEQTDVKSKIITKSATVNPCHGEWSKNQ